MFLFRFGEQLILKLIAMGRDSKQYDFISKTQRSYYTLFIYPTLSSANITIFITNVAVSLGWLRGK